MKAPVPYEHDEQVTVISWAKMNEFQLPELALLHAIPNGMYVVGGVKRRKGVIDKMKAEGMKPGVLDLFWPVARGTWHGLYIEMKRRDKSLSKVSDEQKWWIKKLHEQGYYVSVCWGADEAILTLTEYYNLGEFYYEYKRFIEQSEFEDVGSASSSNSGED